MKKDSDTGPADDPMDDIPPGPERFSESLTAPQVEG